MNRQMRVASMLCCILALLTIATLPSSASARTLYVSAQGSPGGTGTRSAPFQSLAALEQASRPGDTIIVLAAPLEAAPLDGGIALKPGQKLIGDGPKVAAALTPLFATPRITNTTKAHNGDAVVMADNASASNLVILNARRSGVYLTDATGVTIEGNVISASNTSCTPGLGFEGQRFAGRPMHGYAAVMADYMVKAASFAVIGNRIHDGVCMDGIHIRAGGASKVSGRIDQNAITRLQQGKMFVSVLGIALETKDSAVLSVTSDGNSQSFIGNPFGGVPEADCEGLLSHQTGGELHWTISRNTFSHAWGGSSCNGAEFFVTEGHSNAAIAISDSLFLDAQGDMLQNINLGTGETTLTLERVTIAGTRLATEPSGPPESRGSTPAGNEAGRPRGHCLMLVTQGPGGANRAKIFDSAFSNCSGDGVFMYHAPFLGVPGASRELALEVDRSTINTEKGYGLRWANYGAIEKTSVKVRNSFITGALDKAAIALVEDPSGASHKAGSFDFGTATSPGGNCIGLPGPKATELVVIEATFVGNFWGASDQASRMNNQDSRATEAALSTAPSTCGQR